MSGTGDVHDETSGAGDVHDETSGAGGGRGGGGGGGDGVNPSLYQLVVSNQGPQGSTPSGRPALSQVAQVDIQKRIDMAIASAVAPYRQSLSFVFGAGLFTGANQQVSNALGYMNQLFDYVPSGTRQLFQQTTNLGLGLIRRIAGGIAGGIGSGISMLPTEIKTFIAGLIVSALLISNKDDIIKVITDKNNQETIKTAIYNACISIGIQIRYATEVAAAVAAEIYEQIPDGGSDYDSSRASLEESSFASIVPPAPPSAGVVIDESVVSAAGGGGQKADNSQSIISELSTDSHRSVPASPNVLAQENMNLLLLIQIADDLLPISDPAASTSVASSKIAESITSKKTQISTVSERLFTILEDKDMQEYEAAVNMLRQRFQGSEVQSQKAPYAAGGGEGGAGNSMKEVEATWSNAGGEEEQDDEEEGRKSKKAKIEDKLVGGATRRKRRNKQNKKSQRVKKSRRQMRRRTRRNSRKVLWM